VSREESARSPVEMFSALYGSSSDQTLLAVVACVNLEILAQFSLATGPHHKKEDKLSFKSFHGSLCGDRESTDIKKKNPTKWKTCRSKEGKTITALSLIRENLLCRIVGHLLLVKG